MVLWVRLLSPESRTLIAQTGIEISSSNSMKRLAAIVPVYRHNSHADVPQSLVGSFLLGRQHISARSPGAFRNAMVALIAAANFSPQSPDRSFVAPSMLPHEPFHRNLVMSEEGQALPPSPHLRNAPANWRLNVE